MPDTREDLREKVRKRAKGYCEYCYAPMTFSPIGFDLGFRPHYPCFKKWSNEFFKFGTSLWRM